MSIQQAASERREPGPPVRVDSCISTRDLARLAGVSRRTIYRVLTGSPLVGPATRTRVGRLIDTLGYAPDPMGRALAARRSSLVGILLDDSPDQVTLELQEGAIEHLRPLGLELAAHPFDRRAPDYIAETLAFVTRQRIHGLILPPVAAEDAGLLQALARIRCRHARIASAPADGASVTVATQDRQGGAEAARYLFACGHRDIGVIAGPPQSASSRARTAGFVDTLRMRRIDLRPGRIVEGERSFESGLRAALQLLRAPDGPPTALFCHSDDLAAGAYMAAMQMGLRIPDQLSIVGYDDAPLARQLQPGLTSVRWDPRQVGRLAAATLTGAPAHGDACMPPTLVIRESCARHVR